jgi:hypothetical protein
MHWHEMQESNIYLGIYTIEYYFLLEKSGCYNVFLVACTVAIVFTTVPPRRCCKKVGNGYHFAARHRWWAPWLVLLVGPAASTTKPQGVDGGPLRGCYQRGQQQPPLELKKSSMAGPPRGATGRTGSGHNLAARHRWRASWGVMSAGPAAVTTDVGEITDGRPHGDAPLSRKALMAGPLGVAVGESGNSHH